MKTIKCVRRYFIWGMVLFLYGITFCEKISALETNTVITGPSFGDNRKTVTMPYGWEKNPVKYDSSIAKADIVLALDQHLYSALLSFIKKYEKEHHITIVTSEGTCGISAGKLARKQVDIAGYCCPPGDTDRLPGIRFHTIGIAALALLVNADNAIDNVSMTQAQKIFMGDISRWSELSADNAKGQDLPISPFGRLHCKKRPGHWRLLLDNEGLFSPGLQEVGAIPDMISSVSGDIKSIGYEVMWNVARYGGRKKIKALSINGFSPEDSSRLLAGDYPLYRVYNITTWDGDNVSNHDALKLVDYLLQKSGDIDAEFDIVPASHLKAAGWKFQGDELVGEPE